MGISGLPFGSPETKWHLGAGPVGKHIIYYKGEGGGFPKSRPWWVLWAWICPWLVLTPKLFQLCTNQLIVWFCIGLGWMISCHFFLIPSRSSNTPLYPQSVVSQGACPNSSLFHCFHLRLTFESIKELGSTSFQPWSCNVFQTCLEFLLHSQHFH